MRNILYIHNINSFITKDLKGDFSKIGFTDIETTLNYCIGNDILFIEIQLTDNQYDGLELAMHVRLSKDQKLKKCPIFFVTDLNPTTLCGLSPYYQIMYYKGSYIIEENAEKINALFPDYSGADEREIDNIIIERPEYATNHDITNQWCIYKWSIYVGLPANDIPVADEIKRGLYYKYLEKKGAINHSAIAAPFNYTFFHTGKILLIDNDWNKGWGDFFKHILPDTIQFQALDLDYDNITIDVLYSSFESVVNSFNPDVILMDLRLLKSDNTTHNFSSISLMQKANDFNSGIRTILMTASHKAMNIQTLLNEGASSYIIKESPIEFYDTNYTQQAVQDLCEKTDKELGKATFLKEVFLKIKTIKNRFNNLILPRETTYVNDALNSLDIAFELLKGYKEKPEHLKFAFITLFLIVEGYSMLTTVISKLSGQWKFNILDNNGVVTHANPLEQNNLTLNFDQSLSFSRFIFQSPANSRFNMKTLERMSYVLHYRFSKSNVELTNWGELCNLRNRVAAHADINSMGLTIEERHIIGLLDMILDFD